MGNEPEDMPQPRSDPSFILLDLASGISSYKTSTFQIKSFTDFSTNSIMIEYKERDELNNSLSNQFIVIDQEFNWSTRIEIYKGHLSAFSMSSVVVQRGRSCLFGEISFHQYS